MLLVKSIFYSHFVRSAQTKAPLYQKLLIIEIDSNNKNVISFNSKFE